MQSLMCSLLLLLTLCATLLSPALATKKTAYIVYLGSHETDTDVERVTNAHLDILGSFVGSEKAKDAFIRSYEKNINGFMAFLDDDEAARIASHPAVASVFLNRAKKLMTTHSWEFMLLEKNGVVHPSSIWNKSSFGEDVIIANIDTGVWPESKSFSDEGYGDVPARWKGECENNTASGVPCNRKLIGARYFDKAFLAAHGKVVDSMLTPRDYLGHGTHTLSTAAGNFVPGVSLYGILENATAKGGSPRARAAAYKACWSDNCYDGDVLAAFDVAINDGVDVLSVSLGGGPRLEYDQDVIAIGALHAVQHGIAVVCAAGNAGPSDGTVNNTAPWIITVAASTVDRRFVAYAELRSGLRLEGSSLSDPLPGDTFYPLVSAEKARASNASANNATLCLPGTMDPEKVKGKILVCLRGINDRIEKGEVALQAGAVGMILCNDKQFGDDTIADRHVLPATHINYTDGLQLFAYLNTSSSPLGFIAGPDTELGVKPAPVVADFSSRGPNLISPQILKPDITAPGVDIIAAFSEGHSPMDKSNDRRYSYALLSGTSMATPHVAGVVGLLKKLYPDWSPAAIKSAIMTTSRTRDNSKEAMLGQESMKKDTPFAYGSGHLQPNRAMDPGLVYDLSVNDYLDFLCGRGYNETIMQTLLKGYKCPAKPFNIFDFNYPSFAVANMSGTVHMSRTLKNVGTPGKYFVRVREPHGVAVIVEPNVLDFKAVGEEKSFKITLKAKKHGASSGEHRFGGIWWTDGKHYVRSPIAVSF